MWRVDFKGSYAKVYETWHYVYVTDGWTDGRTDRVTDRQICYINIARQYADAR